MDLKKRYHVSQSENIPKESDEKGTSSRDWITVFFLLHISCCRRVAEIFRTFLFVTCTCVMRNIHVQLNIISYQNRHFLLRKIIYICKLCMLHTSIKDCQGSREQIQETYLRHEDFLVFFKALYSTLLHLPPLRFHCLGGCWGRTLDFCDFGIGNGSISVRLGQGLYWRGEILLITILVPCSFSVKSETGKMEAKIVTLRSEKSPSPRLFRRETVEL